MNNWLEELKKGDKVVAASRYHTVIKTIERLTKTQIKLNDYPNKFQLSSGNRVGRSVWTNEYLREATTELIIQINDSNLRNKLMRRIESINVAATSTKDLQTIVNIINKEKIDEEE